MNIETIKTQLVSAIAEAKAAGISQSDISRRANVNTAVVSLIARDIWVNGETPIPDRDIIALAQALNLYRRRHFNTSQFVLVRSFVNTLINKVGVGFLDSAGSGLGKTYTLEYESLQLGNRCIYYKATSTINASHLLDGILAKLGDIPGRRLKDEVSKKKKGRKSNHDKIELIKELFPDNAILIIDELETVRNKAGVYGVLKDLVDYATGKFAIIISGYGLIEYFEKQALKGRNGYVQLHRRLNAENLLIPAISQTDVNRCFATKGQLQPDVSEWVADNIRNYQQISALFDEIWEINQKGKSAKIRREALQMLLTPSQVVTEELLKKYSI